MTLARIPLLLPLLLPALAPPLSAAVPERWKAEASDARPHLAEAYRGETLSLECSLVDGGRPLDLAGASASLHWQTNGMDTLWWDATASVSGSVVRATWTPEMDCGAEAYRFFLRVSDAAGVSYRANGTLRMLGSPGETPSTLPLPRQSLDFAAIEVLNAPWATSLSDLSGDSDHMLVSASEKEAWNGKADAEDLPTKTSDLENDGDGTSLFATLDELGNVSDTANAAWQAAQQALDGLDGKAASSDVVLARRTEYSAWTPIRELTDEEKELFYAEDPSSAQDNYAITVEDTPTANGGAWYVYVGGWRVGVAGSDATGLRLDAISGYPPYMAVFGYPNTLVATRTQITLPGYILGNQSDKPLATLADVPAVVPPSASATAGQAADAAATTHALDEKADAVASVAALPTSAVAARSRDVYRVSVTAASQAVAVALPALDANRVLDIEVVLEVGTGAGVGSITFTVNGSAQTPIWLDGSAPTWNAAKKGGLAVRLLNIGGTYTLLANKYGEW